MTFDTSLGALISAIGADVKSIVTALDGLGAASEPPANIPESARGTVDVTMVEPVPFEINSPDWFVLPLPNSTTAPSQLGNSLSTGGTLTASGTPAISPAAARLPRSLYRVTSAAVGAIAYVRQGANSMGPIRSDGFGGLKCSLIAGPDTGTALSTDIFFMGLKTGATTPTNVDPSTLFNIFGLGYDAADTTIKIMHNDASGAATEVDTGWAVPTADSTDMYELELFSDPTLGTVNYRATRFTATGKLVFQGEATTNLPTNTSFLQFFAYHSTGSTSSVVGLAIGPCQGIQVLV